MGANRGLVFEQCRPEMALAFSEAEFGQRLERIRARMERDGIDVLWLMAPESLYCVSGYKCIWYQAQSPKQWPATSGIAIHRERDDLILFDTPSEAIMCRFVTCAKDVRVFPMSGRRDGIAFNRAGDFGGHYTHFVLVQAFEPRKTGQIKLCMYL